MLGDNIKRFRKEANLSQEALAEKLGVSRQSISLWENNQSQPSIETLLSLSKALNKTTDELLSSKQESPVETVPQNKESTHKKSSKPLFIVIAIIALALIGGACFFWLSSDSPVAKPTILSKNFSENTDAIATAEGSVVKVFCYDHLGNEIATGSGVVLFQKDMIVTNYHVIDDVHSIKVSTDQDITYKVLGVWHQNEKQDIAILKLTQETTLTPLKIGDPTVLKKGETLTAIGSPLGIKNTVSKGNLSARIMQGDYDILQFTAPISNGSSGGALFNEKGEVVGITYASFAEGQNLNLAIPIDLVQKLYQSKSTSIEPTSLEEAYWENHIDEYYEFTYGKPIEVTLEQLKKNPHQYDKKYIKIVSYVSSIDMFKEDLKFGLYISNKSDITKDAKNDEETDNSNNFTKHPFIRVNTHAPFCSYTYGTRKNLSISIGQKIEIIGVFSCWEQGDKMGDGTSIYQYSGAEIDMAYIDGIR